MAGTEWRNFNEKTFAADVNKGGERGVYITEDNIAYAQARRDARRRIQSGQGTAEDHVMIADSERLIRGIREDGGEQ